ncbi:MAG: hypothetical protein E7376_04495 [Clostridiales bacterium]|nr:hypothetical protein [Clostridiales bacterium]
MKDVVEVYEISEVEAKVRLQRDSGYVKPKDERDVERSYKLECEYDPITNISKIYKISNKTGKKSFVKQYDGKVLKIKKDLLHTYLVTCDKFGNMGMIDHSGKTIVEHNYESINFAKVRKTSKTVLRVKDSNGLSGVLSLNGKEILPCKYRNIDFKNSVYANGEVRFLVQGTTKGKYDIFEWGVVNNKGKVLLPFSYRHNGEEGFQRYKHVKEPGRPLKKYFELEDMSTRKAVLVNLEDKNIIANEQVIEGIKKFDKQVEEEARKRAKAFPETLKLIDPKHIEERKREQKRHEAAFATAILTGNPIAGLIVNEILK